MLPPVTAYRLADTERLLTPALLLYPEIVQANIAAMMAMAGGDANRWRPHVKTVKMPAVVDLLMAQRVTQFKCSTTLELLMACRAGARDVLLAYPVMGANAERAKEIAGCYPETKVSVLVESAEQAAFWEGSDIGVFIDVNSGMNRTGIDPGRASEIARTALGLGRQFRGVHFYDGHISGVDPTQRESDAHKGYGRLLELINKLNSGGVDVHEVITSGTPAAPFAMSYAGFRNTPFVHRISPGTVVFNDIVSLEQLPGWGLQPAALVLSTVVSRPKPNVITCDAGHKSVSADAGVPTCAVLGHPNWTPLKPSEEHLPIEVPEEEAPRLGDKIYLLPRHVCPTVNNFDDAVSVSGGVMLGVVPVSARGHESPIGSAEFLAENICSSRSS